MRIIDILNEKIDIWKEAPNPKTAATVHIDKSYAVSVDLDMVKEAFGTVTKDNIEQFAANILSSHPEISAYTTKYKTEMPPPPPPKVKPRRFVY